MWWLSWILLGSRLPGCSCAPLHACRLVREPVVFIGQVVSGGVDSVREDPWHAAARVVRFRVVERYRGVAATAQYVDVHADATFGMCAPNPYFHGKTYLLSLRPENGKLSDGGCFSGRELNASPDVVAYVRDYFAGKTAFTVRGAVETHEKPLLGATVRTSRGGKTYSAVTDARGEYVLRVPANGTYLIEALLPPYPPVSERVTVQAGGCPEGYFQLKSGSSVAGNLWDENGQPLLRKKVELRDTLRDAGLRLNTYTRGTDGRYRFDDVPLGRYELVFDAEGPQRTSREVEVDRAGMQLAVQDLHVGPAAVFRPVRVGVRFSDGEPVKTGLVEVEGASGWKVTRRAGVVQAPADQALTIRLKDQYGREFKREYLSRHGAGTAPITVEFVVDP